MRPISLETALFAVLVTAACDKQKNDTPPTEEIPAAEEDLTVVTSIDSALGPTAENEYAISFVATDGTGASLGTTDLTFVQPGTTVDCTKEIVSTTPLEPCGAGVCVDWNGEWQSLGGVRSIDDGGSFKSGAPPCGYLCDNAGDEKTVDIPPMTANPE